MNLIFYIFVARNLVHYTLDKLKSKSGSLSDLHKLNSKADNLEENLLEPNKTDDISMDA